MKALPPVILQLICANLRPAADKWTPGNNVKRQALRSLCLTDKQWHGPARIELYHTVEIGDFDRERSRLLLRSLVENRELGKFVLQLNVEPWGTEETLDRPGDDLVPAPAELLEVCGPLLERLGLSTVLRARLLEWLGSGLQDAEIAVLLCLCPRLRVLELGLPYCVGETLVVAMFARYAEMAVESDGEGSRLPFDSIEEVKVRHWDTEYSTNLSEITPLLQLRGLKSFRGFAISCDRDSLIEPGSIPSLVKTFELQDSLMDSEGLESVLAACPQVENFFMSWGSATVGDCEILWDQFGDVLRRNGSHITHFTLESDEAFHFMSNGPSETPLGSLKEMSSLRRLNLPFHALFQKDLEDDEDEEAATRAEAGLDFRRVEYLVDILPISLRSLRIDASGDEDPTVRDAQLHHLMGAAEFDELNSIRVKRSEPFSLDLSDLNWIDAKSNQYWVMLNRENVVV